MRFKALTKRDKKLLMLQNQAKLRSHRTSPKHKFGYQTPRNKEYENTLSIDKHNDNKKWAKAIKLEVDQQHECDTYKNVGMGTPPKDHKEIRAHFVFDVKHDGMHKERLVADRNLTAILFQVCIQESCLLEVFV